MTANIAGYLHGNVTLVRSMVALTGLNRGPTPSTMVSVEGARGTYPVDDGDVTVVGRHQQVVVAVWILGFMAGPLPAIIALLVRPGRGVYHRLVVAAAWFWSVAVVVGGISVWLAVERESVWFMAGWVAMLVAGFVASGLAVRTAMRRI
jgi:hypothetical protein